jgi:hypothetical protein
MASSLINVCRFNPTAGGTTDWTYSSAVQGYQSPSAAGAVNGATYSYRAESNDLSQWEIGTGVYSSGTGVLTRAAVLFNSSGTTSKINFSTTPQVAVVALAEDLLLAKGRSTLPTRQVFVSGSGTYNTPANCLWIEVELVGGGAGGAGGGSGSPGSGTSGGNTTFSTMTAGGGSSGSVATPGAAGTATGGDVNIPGGRGQGGGLGELGHGGQGGSSSLGGSGSGGIFGANSAGFAAAANSGSGGGGGTTSATSQNTGTGGSSGGTVRKIITSPAASYSYAVGAGGSGGAAGTSGTAGGNGAAGIIIVTEHYN